MVETRWASTLLARPSHVCNPLQTEPKGQKAEDGIRTYVRTYVRKRTRTYVRTYFGKAKPEETARKSRSLSPTCRNREGSEKRCVEEGREGERGERAITDTREDDAHTYVRTCVRTHVEGVRTYVWHVAAKREGAPPG